MGTPIKLRIVLGENDCEKLNLPSGIPASLEELQKEIQTQLGYIGDFRLQFRDAEFDNEFVNLKSTANLQDKATLKVIKMSCRLISPSTPTLPDLNECISLSSADTDMLSSPQTSGLSSPHTSSLSSSQTSGCSSPLTSGLSSLDCASSLRSQTWPTSFPIPEFVYDTELELQKTSVEYKRNGRKLKTSILEGLASQIMKFKAYPSLSELGEVAAALIQKHPCLKERGSVSGCGGWTISLRDKMGNYKTKLRKLGCPELEINSMKRKQSEGRPNQVKKTRRAEVNYCPEYPAGENKDSLEQLRLELLSEVTKRNNHQVVKEKMDRTFAYRRREVLEDMPYIAEFKGRWPALFTERDVSAEFSRITTVPLLSKFMHQLDHYSAQLIRVFRNKGGMAATKIRTILSVMGQNNTTEMKHECVLKALAVHLNEDSETLVKEYLDVDQMEAQRSMAEIVVGIYVIKHEGAEPMDPYEDVGVIIEGVEVLQGLGNVANACAMMLGLIYALNLAYPDGLKYTLEAFQKLAFKS